MERYTSLLIAAFLLVLSGCSAKYIEPGSETVPTLEAGEGILAIVFKPNRSFDYLELKGMETEREFYKIYDLDFDDDLRLLVVPADRYCVKAYKSHDGYSYSTFFEIDLDKTDVCFDVTAGELNYGGHLYIGQKWNNGMVGVRKEYKSFLRLIEEKFPKVTAEYFLQ